MESTSPQRTTAELLEDLQTHQVELEMQNLQLRETQSLLDASRQKYLGLFDQAPVPYLIFNQQHAIEEINLAGASLLRLERSDLVLRPFAYYLADESRPIFHQHVNAVLGTGSPQSVELRLPNAQGDRVLHLLASSSRLTSQPGIPPRVLMTAFDMTAERLAQSQQREAE